MPFKKGNKHGRHGKQPGAGRPSKEQQKIKHAIAEIARAYIEEHIKFVLESYFKLTQGREVKHYDPKGNLAYTEEIIDGATVRHWMDKFIPVAKQEFHFIGDIKHQIRQSVIDRIIGRTNNEL